MKKNINQSGHSLIEDIFSIFCGIIVFSVGVLIIKSVGIIAGGTAGISLILSYTTDISFGVWFVIVSSPFFIISLIKLGIKFTIMTVSSIVISSLIVDNLKISMELNHYGMFISSLFGGILIGVAILILARHRASLGGFYILGVYLQDKNIINMGKLALISDCIIMSLGYYFLNFELMFFSLLTTIIYNVFIMINHKPGRYLPNEISKNKKLAKYLQNEAKNKE